MRSFKGIDVSPYGKAFLMLAKYPQVMVGPLVAGILQFVVLNVIPTSGGSDAFGGLSASIYQLLGTFISSLGFAFAIIAADDAWRGGRVTIPQTWETAQRRIGDIFFATIGFGFVVYVAALVGGVLGGFGSLLLTYLAYFFFVYTLVAATIGGIPGSAALQASFERARDNPIDTLLLTVAYLFGSRYLAGFIVGTLLPMVTFDYNPFVAEAIDVVTTTVVDGYLAFVFAKVYANLAFGRRRW